MIKKVDKCLWCGSSKLKKIATRKDGVGIIECQVCGLDMVDAIPENLDEYYYSEEYYNAGEVNVGTGYADIYDLMAPAFLLWQNSIIESLNESHDKKTFLEIGCATGNLLEIIRKFQPNLELKGIDVSKYAAGAARHKGFDVDVAYIEEYSPGNPIDIIFSSETLEHLDNLKSFLEGVKKNLAKDGVFVFYVPSIQRDAAIEEGSEYVRFTHNFEHLLHFTPAFMQKEIPHFFGAKGIIEEFVTGFGPCIVGAVSNNTEALNNFKVLLGAVQDGVLPKRASSYMLKNIATMAMKFGKEKLALDALSTLATHEDNLADDVMVLKGISGYHTGHLHESNAALINYLGKNPGDLFAIRSMLANEIELDKIYTAQINELANQKAELEARAFMAEEELVGIKNSRVPGTALKVMIKVGKAKTKSKYIALSGRDRLKAFARRPLPSKIRSFLGRTKTKILTRKQLENNTVHKGPLVSVVIPYYNRHDTIDETIASLREQSFTDFEVILVNDGSTSLDAKQKLLHLDTSKLNFTLVHQKNAGVASARNHGIDKARGRYIVCLDSDDMLEPTYLEKGVVLLETNANLDVFATDMRFFGVQNLVYPQGKYNPLELMHNNMIHTAAMFRKTAWEDVGGYKSNLGYEDWEFWINLAEHGHMGKVVSEPLFRYRTAITSRYIEDKKKHTDNLRAITKLHGNFRSLTRRALFIWKYRPKAYIDSSKYINLDSVESYRADKNDNPGVLLLLPWMTFGGAETLVLNFCREIKDDFNLSFITGLKSNNEWEYKFKEITDNIYHLGNLFDAKEDYLGFISNYILTRGIHTIHIVHTDFPFDLLPEIKAKHPDVHVVVTIFNDRAGYIEQLDTVRPYIDMLSTDNRQVAEIYGRYGWENDAIRVIPNGIDCYTKFNQSLYGRDLERSSLKITGNQKAIFFIGRLSEEKNPDVFVKAAIEILRTSQGDNLKFFVIGDGPMKPVIEKQIARFNDPRLQYLGYQEDIPRFLSAADIFVLPSSVEGFPLSILEAMAMRVAVVASDVGAVSDVISSGKDGFIVRPGSVADIVEDVSSICSDEDAMNAIKDNARLQVESKYSNLVLGENYKSLYMKGER